MNQRHPEEREIEQLKVRLSELEARLEGSAQTEPWAAGKYYTAYHVLSGMMVGFLGAVSSLLFNVVGSVLIGQHPLELIRVYLTFPLGERALHVESGAILALGCCLYLATGIVYGVVLHVILSRFFEGAGKIVRFVVASVVGLLIWAVNYYGILSWAQPAFFGGDWIVRMVPFWVAALTHLVFAWTLLAVDELARFDREGHPSNKAK